MTEKEWLKYRDLKELPMKIWYEYYVENKGALSFEDFVNVFPQILGQSTISIINGVSRELSFDSAIRRIHRYYNEKFGL